MTESPDREQRRRRREALRRAHPDLGGDPEEFIRVARLFGVGAPASSGGGPHPTAGSEVRFVRRPRGLSRVPAWWRGRLERWRHPAPRRVI